MAAVSRFARVPSDLTLTSVLAFEASVLHHQSIMAERAMSQGYQATADEAEKVPTQRKASAFKRKSTVPDVPAAIVEASELSVADRRLAELGYVQVGTPTITRLQSHTDWALSRRYTSASSPGCPASPSPSPSPASTLPSPPPIYTRWKPAELPRQYGAG